MKTLTEMQYRESGSMGSPNVAVLVLFGSYPAIFEMMFLPLVILAEDDGD